MKDNFMARDVGYVDRGDGICAEKLMRVDGG
jgi:hypothetical protein